MLRKFPISAKFPQNFPQNFRTLSCELSADFLQNSRSKNSFAAGFANDPISELLIMVMKFKAFDSRVKHVVHVIFWWKSLPDNFPQEN